MRLDELGDVDGDREVGGEFSGARGFGFATAIGEENEFDRIFFEELKGGSGGGDWGGAVHEDAVDAATGQREPRRGEERRELTRRRRQSLVVLEVLESQPRGRGWGSGRADGTARPRTNAGAIAGDIERGTDVIGAIGTFWGGGLW